MRIIQFGSAGAALILQEQIKYLLSNVVGIGGYFFFVCRQVHNSISLVLDHGECYVPLVFTWLSIVGTTSLKSIFQTSFGPEIL